MENLIKFLDEEVGKSILFLNCGKHGGRFYAVITIQSGYIVQLLTKGSQFGLHSENFEYTWAGNTLFAIEKVK